MGILGHGFGWIAESQRVVHSARSPAEKPGIGEKCRSVCPVQTENVGKSEDLSRLSGCAGRVLLSRRSHAGFSAMLLVVKDDRVGPFQPIGSEVDLVYQ